MHVWFFSEREKERERQTELFVNINVLFSKIKKFKKKLIVDTVIVIYSMCYM